MGENLQSLVPLTCLTGDEPSAADVVRNADILNAMLDVVANKIPEEIPVAAGIFAILGQIDVLA